jgi:PBP1b-binding outer membrane lipoprotein LpoB
MKKVFLLVVLLPLFLTSCSATVTIKINYKTDRQKKWRISNSPKKESVNTLAMNETFSFVDKEEINVESYGEFDDDAFKIFGTIIVIGIFILLFLIIE